MESFVCVLSTDDYLEGVLVLDYNLKQLSTKYPLLCLINESISDRTKQILDYFGIKYKLVNKVNYSSSTYNRWNYTFDKLNVFSLTEYDKIIYLDSDLLILKNIDDLFNIKRFTMTSDIPFYYDKLNSAVMIIKPNIDDYNGLVELAKKYDEEKKDNIGDQNVINDFFKGRNVFSLDASYNEMRVVSNETEQILDENTNEYIKMHKARIVTENVDNPVIIHYISQPKPFMVDGLYMDEYSHIYKNYLDKVRDKIKESNL
jgi:alpha-N-acetylglucosamine transferase